MLETDILKAVMQERSPEDWQGNYWTICSNTAPV